MFFVIKLANLRRYAGYFKVKIIQYADIFCRTIQMVQGTELERYICDDIMCKHSRAVENTEQNYILESHAQFFPLLTTTVYS